MAILSEEDRQRVWRGLMRWWSVVGRGDAPGGLLKADLRAAVDATDTWIENNQAAFNSALPAAARSGLTLTQKTLLFCAVALARVGLATLRSLFGEVD